MSHSFRATLLGLVLFSVGCGPASSGVAPVASQVSNLTTVAAAEIVVTDFAYNFTFERGSLRSLACGYYRVELVATFSQFPARVMIQNCLGATGALTQCQSFHDISCDLGTGICAAKNFDELTPDPSVITLTQDSGNYTVRVASASHFQACSTYVPYNVRFKIQGLNSVQSSPWTEAGCGTDAHPPLNHSQCR